MGIDYVCIPIRQDTKGAVRLEVKGITLLILTVSLKSVHYNSTVDFPVSLKENSSAFIHNKIHLRIYTI